MLYYNVCSQCEGGKLDIAFKTPQAREIQSHLQA